MGKRGGFAARGKVGICRCDTRGATASMILVCAVQRVKMTWWANKHQFCDLFSGCRRCLARPFRAAVRGEGMTAWQSHS
jgi:hypothetical protein